VKVVIDTNVLVSGLLSPYGASAEVMRLAVAGALIPLYDARILGEYREVVLEREFDINREYVPQLLDAFESNGEPVIATPLKTRLPDPDDEMLREVALSGGAAFLVTFNRKHFPAKVASGVQVVEPKAFLDAWRQSKS
jgi:putative PIN family toxin of toxin-antitoxin system